MELGENIIFDLKTHENQLDQYYTPYQKLDKIIQNEMYAIFFYLFAVDRLKIEVRHQYLKSIGSGFAFGVTLFF
ncbi:unnamed protein product [Schistosoma guineensis]|nr:unnamed protein product [Schistosoma guineensis]